MPATVSAFLIGVCGVLSYFYPKSAIYLRTTTLTVKTRMNKGA